MAEPKVSSTHRLNLKNIILLILSSSLLLSHASAVSVQRANSCSSLRSMARVYMASGGYEKAQPFLVKALLLAQQTNASDTEVSSCMLDLAYLYKSQGKLAEAEKVCRSGLKLQEKAYGQSHPYVAYTLRILSEIYRNQARYREATKSLQRAMTIVRGFCLDNDKELAPFEVDMARLLAAQGDYVKAESYYKQALSSIENNYGPSHVYTTKVLCSMAALYVNQGRFAEAEELISRVLPIQERVYGPNHHFLVPAWLVQSSIYEAEGNLIDAKILLEKSLGSIEKIAGEEYVVECDVLNRFGQLYILSKEYNKAQDILQRELRILEDSNGSETDRAAIALNSLAKVCLIQGKFTEAQNLCTRALDMLENIFDENHPDIAYVLDTQVKLNREAGNMAEAARLEHRAEEIRKSKRITYAPIAQAVE